MKAEQKFEYLLITHCAPTLAGLKDGSMFNFSFEGEDSLEEVCGSWKEILNQKGLGMEILRDSGKKALVYVYWKKRLKELLENMQVRKVLGKYGYDREASINTDLEKLKKRIRESMCVPDEIGVFLGYPLEDVLGFIKNRGKNCALCGYWKVYCNKHKAEQTFELYTKCREMYQKLFANGVSVLQMISV